MVTDLVKNLPCKINTRGEDLKRLHLLSFKIHQMGKSLGEEVLLRYDLPNGFTYLQLGRDFINLFLFKYMPF